MNFSGPISMPRDSSKLGAGSSVQKPNVLLLYPKTGQDYGSTVAPPHALITIAAPVLKSGYSVEIIDQRTQLVNKDVLRNLISSDLFCVGISTMTGLQVRYALGIARMVRELTDGNVPIVWGGCHPSVMPDQTLANENVDIVVVGEGDDSFLEIIKALENKESLENIQGIIYKNGSEVGGIPYRPLMNVEDLLPTPWELIDVENYIHRDIYLRGRDRVLDLGQTSRGCPFDCGFCSSASIRGRKWRAMTVEKSLEMIIGGVDKFNLDGFWLRDDEFYIKRKRAHAIFEGIIESEFDVKFYTSGTRADVLLKARDEEYEVMKRAGIHSMKIGAESGSQRILDLMQKGLTVEQTIEANLRCKQYGMAPIFSLMIGYPTETFEEMDMTIDMAFRLRKDNPMAQTETMSQFTALPGTPDFELAKRNGIKVPEKLEDWCDWFQDSYDFEGARSPWYSKKERIYLGNISYMSQLSSAFENLMGTGRNKFLAAILQKGARVIGKIYRSWLRNKKYKFRPELKIVQYLRRKIFELPTEPSLKIWSKYRA